MGRLAGCLASSLAAWRARGRTSFGRRQKATGNWLARAGSCGRPLVLAQCCIQSAVCALRSVRSALCTVQCALCTVQYTVCSVKTAHSTLHTVSIGEHNWAHLRRPQTPLRARRASSARGDSRASAQFQQRRAQLELLLLTGRQAAQKQPRLAPSGELLAAREHVPSERHNLICAGLQTLQSLVFWIGCRNLQRAAKVCKKPEKSCKELQKSCKTQTCRPQGLARRDLSELLATLAQLLERKRVWPQSWCLETGKVKWDFAQNERSTSAALASSDLPAGLATLAAGSFVCLLACWLGACVFSNSAGCFGAAAARLCCPLASS